MIAAQMAPADRQVDLLLTHALIVTLDAGRRILSDGALAVRGDRIVAVGKTHELRRDFDAKQVIDAGRFVIVPGLVNAHIHVTGEPLTRGCAPDDVDFNTLIFDWLSPVHFAHTPADEKLAAQFAALEMLRTGTTCFLDAGTCCFLDQVVEGMESMGIRGRLGRWSWDGLDAPMSAPTGVVVDGLQRQLERYPAGPDRRLSAWPILIGHYTCTDALWQAAKALADEHGAGLAFHMSPVPDDAAWFLERHGRRPFQHLAELGVLSRNVVATHAVHLDASEVALLGAAGASVAHCPMTALRGAYGATTLGRFPELVAAGANLALGSDGSNDSNSADLHRAMFLLAGMSKDARRDPTLFPAHQAIEHATLGGARALLLEDQIGSLEPGKKADFVLHDIDRPEWRPLLNVVNQLVWSVDGRSVHSVWVDGVRVVENYRSTMIDEDRLYAEVEAAGRRILGAAGLPDAARWTTS